MFTKTIIALTVSALATMAVASPAYPPQGGRPSQGGFPGENQRSAGRPNVDNRNQDNSRSSSATQVTAVDQDVESKCNSGPVQCCETVQDTQNLDPFASGLAGLLGALDILGASNGNMGINCSPLVNVIPIASGNNNCASQPVCCENNEFGGLISVGCNPINIGL